MLDHKDVNYAKIKFKPIQVRASSSCRHAVVSCILSLLRWSLNPKPLYPISVTLEPPVSYPDGPSRAAYNYDGVQVQKSWVTWVGRKVGRFEESPHEQRLTTPLAFQTPKKHTQLAQYRPDD